MLPVQSTLAPPTHTHALSQDYFSSLLFATRCVALQEPVGCTSCLAAIPCTQLQADWRADYLRCQSPQNTPYQLAPLPATGSQTYDTPLPHGLPHCPPLLAARTRTNVVAPAQTWSHLHKRGCRQLADSVADLFRARDAAEHGRHARLNVAVAVELERGAHRVPSGLLHLRAAGLALKLILYGTMD